MDKDGTPLSLDPSAIRHQSSLKFLVHHLATAFCSNFDETFIKTPEGLQITQPYCEPAVVLSNTGVLGRYSQDRTLSEQEEQFHHFFFARPAYENPLCDQPQFRYIVQAEFLERRLSDYIVMREPRKQFRLLCALTPLPQALDLVYKPCIVSHICETTAPLLCHLVINRLSPSFELGPGLSLERLPVEQGRGMREYRDNTIYLPQSGGGSLDTFVISENKTRVTMLHFVVAPTHKLESSGIYRVMDELNGKLAGQKCVRWPFLFVAPDDRGKLITNSNMNFKLSEEYPKIHIGSISTDDEMDQEKWYLLRGEFQCLAQPLAILLASIIL